MCQGKDKEIRRWQYYTNKLYWVVPGPGLLERVKFLTAENLTQTCHRTISQKGKLAREFLGQR